MKSVISWRVVKLATIGAVAFWLPDVAWQLLLGDKFDRFDVLGVTILMPLTLLAAYLLLRRRSRLAAQEFRGWPLMLGVWELGGYFILLSASFHQGGFATMHGFSDIPMAVLLPLIPIYTFVMAAYDGSLLALMVVTVAGGIMFCVRLSTSRG